MAKAGELKFVITVDEKGAVKSVKGFNDEVKNTEKTTKKTNKTLDRYSKALKRSVKIAALAAAAAMAVAIKKTIDFNKEIALTATMMPGMVDEVNELKRNVQDLSVQYGKSTIDMAKGSFLVVSAFGAQAAQSRKLEITAKAAAAGNAETAASLSLLSAVTKGYGVITDEAFQKASDLAFQTVKFGQTDFPALAASMGKVIPVAAAMGVKQEELFTGFATLTGVTGNAAEVSTQLSGILRAMIKPTEGMKQAIKELGFETAEQMIEQEGLVGSMRMLVKNTDGTSESIGKLFRRAEALTAVFALTGGQADVFNQKFEELKKSAGATDQAFREISDGVNKAGFSLEQAKQSFSVFTQRIADSTLQSDDFNDALQGLKRSFESKEFVAAIASITSAIIKFVAHLVEGIAAFSEWMQQASDSQERFANQATEWENSFDTIYDALRQAGLSFEEYNRITSEMASSKEIDALREQQSDLNKELSRFEEILERDRKAGLNNRTIEILATETKQKLNEITAERNDLLLNQTFEIFKNSDATGENSEIIAKARAILQGNLTAQKEVTKETEANTESLAKNSIELSEVEKIANKYGVSLTSATAILQKQQPELAEIAKLQNDLGVSLEEATKTYKILNGLEKSRNETLKVTKQELREIPEAQELVNEQTLIAIDLVPKLNEWQMETNEGLREAKIGLEEKARASIIAESAAAALAREEEQLAKNLKLVTQALDILSGLSFVPDKLAAGLSAMGTAAQQIVSGDWLGLIGTGVSFISDMFGPDGVTGQVEVATEALREFGVTGEEAIKKLSDAYEELLSSMSMSDLLNMTAEDWENTMDDMADMAEEVAKSTREFYEPIRDAIPDLEKFLAVPAKNAEDFNAQVTITLGAFANMLKSGLSITQALAEMDGAFENLIASQDALGLEGNKAFEALKQFRGLIKDNQALVDSVEGLNAVMEATAALGGLSQEQMDAFGTSAQQKFDELTKAGFNNQQALSLIAPTLLQLKENAEKYGTELDANTQKLINQAEESGVFNEMTDPLETIASILEQIFYQLGGTEDALASFGDTAEQSNQAANDGLEEIDVNIKKIGDTALDTAGVMAKSMDVATESMTGNIMNLQNESMKAFNNMAADAVAASREMKGSFSGLGNNNRIQPPVLPLNRNIPGFKTGGSGVVPPGFSNDDFHIGLSSGEPFVVGGANTTTNNRTDNMSITLMQEVTREDTVDSIALKTIQALKEKRYGLDKEIKKAIGTS
jgi:TP901 family phage tail tape measure protein